MEKRFSVLVFICVIFFTLISADYVLAVGLGIYGQTGGGSAEWDAEGRSGNFDFDSDTGHAGLGVVFDSNVAKDRLFNYRLNVGYEKIVHDPENTWGDIELDTVVLDQDFGFGLVRKKNLRFWVGPELRLSYSEGSPDDISNFDLYLVGFGIGPVAGVNFHMSPAISLALKAGVLAIGYAGTLEDSSGFISDTDYEMSEGYAFINIAILFRVNE